MAKTRVVDEIKAAARARLSKAVGVYTCKDFIVSTMKVHTLLAGKPFETAVSHLSYNGGNWVIVEEYGTKAKALAGHRRWVATMTGNKLPDKLVDVGTSAIAKILRQAHPEKLEYSRKESQP